MNESLNDIIPKTNKINLKRTTPKHSNTSVRPYYSDRYKKGQDTSFKIKYNEKTSIIILFIPIVLSFFISSFFEKYENFTLDSLNTRINSILLLVSLIESSIIIFLLWKYIIKDIIDDIPDKDYVLLFIIPIMLLIAPYGINSGMIYYLNQKLDSKKPIIRYLKVIDRTISESYSNSSKRNKTTYHYNIHLTSWHKKPFKFQCSENEYNNNKYKRGEIVKIKTSVGYFGMEYYYNEFPIVENMNFPKGTKFPITDEELKKIKQE